MDLKCPRCDDALQPGQFGAVDVQMCSGCASLIVAIDKTIALLTQVGADLPEAEVEAEIVPHADDGMRNCPACRSLMTRFPYMGTGEVLLDRCSACRHLFLDVEEVTAAATLYVRTHGRVASNRADAEAHQEILEEISRVAQLKRRMRGRFSRY